MKHITLLAVVAAATVLSSCYIPPEGLPGPAPRSPYSPGGRYVTPGEHYGYGHTPYRPGYDPHYGHDHYRPGYDRYRRGGSDYGSPGRYGLVIEKLPSGARRVQVGGLVYYTYRSEWYHARGGSYVVCPPPH